MDMGQGSTLYHSAVNFNITLPSLTKISGLDDMFISELNRPNNRNFLRNDETFCVFVWGAGDYAISADSDTGSDFFLNNGTDTIKYIVRLSQQDSGLGLTTVAPNQQVVSTGGSSSINCNNTSNARVRIRINDSEMVGKSTGAYTSRLTLTVQAL